MLMVIVSLEEVDTVEKCDVDCKAALSQIPSFCVLEGPYDVDLTPPPSSALLNRPNPFH